MFRLDVLRSPERRGLKGLKLVISDAHEGPTAQHQMVAAAIGTVFMPADHATASVVRSQVADQLRARLPKSAAPMDEAEADAIAIMPVPGHTPSYTSCPGVVTASGRGAA